MISTKKIFIGVLFGLSLGLSSQVYAQDAEGTTNSLSDCENPEKKASRDSSCLISATMTTAKSNHSSPMGIAGGVSKISPFSISGASCTTPWGATVPDGGSVSAFLVPSGTYDYAGKTWATECQEENRYCLNGTLSGSYTNQSCDLQPVNGSCGSANGQYYTYPTSGPAPGTLCNPEYTYGGVAPTDESAAATPANSSVTLNSSTNRYSWTCSGEVGGSTASCQAFRRINGQCGSSINSCSLGSTASTSSSNNYNPNYACNCSTNTSGVTTCTASPTGTQTCVGGYRDTTYNWQCTGVNTGSTASCTTTGYDSSQVVPTPPPCGPALVNDTQSCTSGYTGTRSRTNNVDTCTNTVLSYGTWDESGCTASCGTTTTPMSGACPSGTTGTRYRDRIYNSCTGVTTYSPWDEDSCVADPVCSETTTSESGACPSGTTGTRYRDKIVNSCSGTSYSSWDESGCVADPTEPDPPTCWEDSWPNTYSCPANHSGENSSITYMECPSGPYGSPTFTQRDFVYTCEPDPPTCWEDSWGNDMGCPAGYDGENTSVTYMECPDGPYGSPTFTQRDFVNTCTPPPPEPTCWEDSWPNDMGCPAGYDGENTSVTYMECPSGPYGSPTFTQRDFVNTCTPPAPTGCYLDGGYVGAGATTNMCSFGSGPFPSGNLLECDGSSWVVIDEGDSSTPMHCN